MIVAPEELAKLIPHAVTITHWLKEKAPTNAADVLIGPPSPKTRENVNQCINQFITALTESDTNELSNAQMRYILSNYSVKAWAHTLKEIVCYSNEPPLISSSIKIDLVNWAFHFLQGGGTNWEELFPEIGKSMTRLGHVSFQALGEFCSLIRDCTQHTEPRAIAAQIGWDLLGTPGTSKKVLSERRRAAGSLLNQMIVRAEALFGQAASPTGFVAFGVRSNSNGTQWSLVHTLPPEKKAMQDLRTFYSYLDKKFVSIVEELFKYHDFPDLAEAINNKYGMIPAPWKSMLNKMKQDKKHPLRWFNNREIMTPTPGAARPPRARNISPLLPIRPSVNDRFVDNFIDTEVIFYRRVGSLGSIYVAKLNEIAHARNSQQARDLNLSQQEIDYLFGYRFQKILDLTHTMLTQLEVINLTRRHLKDNVTREGILAKVIVEVAPEELFNSYVHYSVTYPQCSELLRDKIERRGMTQRRGHDFLDIWHNIRGRIRTLEDKSLEEVMELPVRRVQTYKEILKEIMHNTRKDTSTYRLLFSAYTAVKKAADALTKASEQEAKKIYPGQ